MRPKVLIIGGGFGGLECARRLSGSELDVALVDRNNYHLFTPLLYQVASSLLNPSDIAYPIRAALRSSPNVRFRMGEVRGVDLAGRRVRLDGGEELAWDYLVLASGSESFHFGLDSVARRASGLKDLPEAMALRNHVLRCFEEGERENVGEARRAWLTFVIAGGGPTGVEYAGALAELARLVVAKDYPGIAEGEVRVLVVEGLKELFPSFPESLGRHARERLGALGVAVRLGVRVAEAGADEVRLSDGSVVRARTLVWAAGVKAGALASALDAPKSRTGRIEVDEFLRVKGHERAYAIGDAASVVQGGREIPMIATPAIQEGRQAARNILRAAAGLDPVPFLYKDRGMMATIGRNAGVAQVGGATLSGRLGWLAWLVVHLYFLIGFRNRLAVLLGWAWNYLRLDRPIRLIARAGEQKR